MSLTDRLKRSYSAAKDKPNSKQSCTRFKGDHNSRIIKDSQSFSIPHTYGHGKTEGPLRCLGIWCTWPRFWVWTSSHVGAWFQLSGWRSVRPRDGVTRHSCWRRTSPGTDQGQRFLRIPLQGMLGNVDLKGRFKEYQSMFHWYCLHFVLQYLQYFSVWELQLPFVGFQLIGRDTTSDP